MRLLPLSKIYKINGRAIPSPSFMNFTANDVHTPDSGRTLDAMMHIKVVRFGVRSISITYDQLAQEEMRDLLGRFHNTTYKFTYPDPEYGVRTIQCYVPERKSDFYSACFYDGLWRNITFNCIQI